MNNNVLKGFSIFLGIFYGIFYLVSIYKYITAFKLDKLIASLSLLASIFIPFIASKLLLKKRIELSPLFHIIFLSFIFAASYLGTVCNFYNIYPWWDTVLHFLSGVFFAMLGVYLINIFTLKKVIGHIKSLALILFISLCLSITATTLWEVFEYICDTLLKTDMTNHSLDDTMIDTISGCLGALATCIIIYYIKCRKGNNKKSQ